MDYSSIKILTVPQEMIVHYRQVPSSREYHSYLAKLTLVGLTGNGAPGQNRAGMQKRAEATMAQNIHMLYERYFACLRLPLFTYYLSLLLFTFCFFFYLIYFVYINFLSLCLSVLLLMQIILRGSIAVRLTSYITGVDLTKQVNLLFIYHKQSS